jgi:Fur family ferric uptake transcriptional regulator
MKTVKELLKTSGQRLTFQKKLVLGALKQRPQTVLEIYSAVHCQNTKINKTTVYRILENFLQLGLINKVQLNDNETRFELKGKEHHHHLVCENCGKIEDILLPEELLLKEVSQRSAFKIRTHSLEFFGICKKCQQH